MEITPGAPQHISAAQPSSPRDRRDVRRAIEHWLRNTWAADSIPLLDTFDFSPMRGDWGQRFLICGGDAVEDAVFVTYGLGFARLLGLPQKAVTTIPFLQQIPELYRGMFSEGYSKVIIETGPVHLKIHSPLPEGQRPTTLTIDQTRLSDAATVRGALGATEVVPSGAGKVSFPTQLGHSRH